MAHNESRPISQIFPFAFGIALFGAGITHAGADPYPETPVREVVHTYGHVQLVDPFSWLEADDTPEAEAWFRAQDQFARDRIGQMPGRDDVFARIKEIDEAKTVQIYTFGRSGNRFFYLKREVGEEVGSLFYRDGIDGEGHLIVDPACLASAGGINSIEYYQPSPDGELVAVAIAPSGSEIPDLYLIDVVSATVRQAVIPRVRSQVAWLDDGSGFYYRQMRPEDPAQAQVDRYKRQPCKFHRLGADPEIDPVVISYDINPTPGLGDADSVLVLPVPETDLFLAYISRGVDRSKTLYFARDIDPYAAGTIQWIPICTRDDKVENFDIHGEDIFLLSSRDAPRRKILRGRLDDYNKDRLQELVPQSSRVLTGLSALGERLYVTGMEGGIDFLMTLDLADPVGGFEDVALPLIGQLTLLNNDYRMDDVYISLTSWERAAAYYRIDPVEESVELSPLRPLGPYDAPEGIVSARVMVRSHDGIEVPLTIIHHASVQLNGTNPTILYGYGAYGISMRPSFGPTRLAWLEKGGIYAVAHVRGGGEFGDAWHEGGHLERKRNSWLDFHVCAEYLIEHGYTAPAHLGAMGGSMGGVLVGRAVTSRPELYGAVVSHVGNHNPVRNHQRANGPANYPEYGNPLDPEEFPYVLAMDSYFSVREGVPYPPMLFTSGYNDARVDPWMPGKMAARLQQADPEGGPFLLRVEFEAGHGGVARSDIWEEIADTYTFLFHALSD